MGKKNLKYQSPGINEGTRFEKLHTVTFDNSEIASNLIAREICDLVKSKQEKGKNCVLGFATGPSPTLLYKEILWKLFFHDILNYLLFFRTDLMTNIFVTRFSFLYSTGDRTLF